MNHAAARIRMLPVDDARGASTRWRVLAHRPALERAGFETRVDYPIGRGRAPAAAWRILDLAWDAFGPRDADVLLVHRKTFPPPFDGLLPHPGRRFVFDFDDAIDLPPPGVDLGDAERRRYRRNFEATAAAADLVICGNDELERRVPHDRTVVLPTPIDAERFRPGAVAGPSGPAVGWVGHSDNLDYLERLGGALRELSRRHAGLEVVVVCDRRPVLAGVRVTYRPWSLDRELEGFAGIGVGLMPLEDTPWARSKCAFKAIQYMALGIPAVVSPVGMNREVVTHGENGYLAARERDWVDAVDALLADRELAARIGRAGRETVAARYALDAISPRLVDAIREVLAGARSRR